MKPPINWDEWEEITFWQYSNLPVNRKDLSVLKFYEYTPPKVHYFKKKPKDQDEDDEDKECLCCKGTCDCEYGCHHIQDSSGGKA